MNGRILGVVVCITLFLLWTPSRLFAQSSDKPFVHPGMLHTRADLDFMKQKVLAGEQPWKDAWERLRSSRNASLDFRPKPFAHVIRGPYNNPAIGSNEISASADAAYCHAIQWYITGDKAHARKAIEVLNAWSPVLQDFQQNDAKLLAAWTGHDFLNAAEILQHTNSGWEAKDVEQFKKMIMGVYYPLLKDFFPEANGNWDAAIMDAMLCVGVFFDDRQIFDRAVEHYLRGHLNGGITHYVYPSGQCQESTRDQGHTQLGLGEMAMACQVAWNQGVDLYAAADSRLALGFEYTAKYLQGEDVLCEDVISPVGRGRFSDIYQLVYQHYRLIKGMEMPYSQRAAERTLARSLTALTLYRGPTADTQVAKLGPPKPITPALNAGAMREPSVRPPANAVVVEPGQSIQTIVDGRRVGGGWIVLNKGVHTLPAPLRLYSKMTISGQGEGTILMLDPQLSGAAIVNQQDALQDVTLRDLVIEGAKTSKLPSDPNSARRNRSKADAPSRGGIRLAWKNVQMRNLRLEHVTVRNCTDSGVVIEGASGIAIAACSFTDNGGGVAPGAGSHHNLALAQVSDCQVSQSRLNNSPAGCGVNIADGRRISISDCEIARSVLRGIRATDSEDVSIRGNLIEGNEAGGVWIGGDKGESRRVGVSGNRMQNNGGYAIEMVRAAESTATDNRLIDNGKEQRPAGASATVRDATPLAEAFERGMLARDVQLASGGKFVVLNDVNLVEDDGPGACASREYGPAAPTVIRGGTQIKKLLNVDRAATNDARLVMCVVPVRGETSPLVVNVNGKRFEVSVTQFRPTSNDWPDIRLPAGILVDGDNSIILSCPGEKGWSITTALRQFIVRNDPARKDRPNRSFRSTDGGQTWSAGLGDEGKQDGELMVRLHLNQYVSRGELIGPVIDLAALASSGELAPNAQVDSVRVEAIHSLPDGTAVQMFLRCGDTPVYDPACWSDWRSVGGAHLNRFVQWRAVLTTSQPKLTPALQGVEIEARVRPRQPSWTDKLRILDSHNEQILYTSMPFEYEKFDEPQLVELRRKYKLDDVVAGAKSELEKIIRLRHWVSAQWKYDPPVSNYPAWDAHEILRQRKGFCVQYAITNMQCCLAMGLQARFVFGHFPNVTLEGEGTYGHEVTEVWSNELAKWVVMDANLDECFVSRRTGIPASMFELHEDQLNSYFPQGFDAAGAVFDKSRPSEGLLRWKGLEPAPRPEKPVMELKWGYLQWMPRNNFYRRRFPEPLLQGHTWSWTGYWSWEDNRSPKQLRFGRYTHRHSDINWTINQVRWAATPAETPGTVHIVMGTVTPDFETFLISRDGGEWQPSGDKLDWQLRPGQSRIEMRTRNRAGVMGPKSWVELEYR